MCIRDSLRGKLAEAIPAIFDKHLMAEIAERRATEVKQVFSYTCLLYTSRCV